VRQLTINCYMNYTTNTLQGTHEALLLFHLFLCFTDARFELRIVSHCVPILWTNVNELGGLSGLQHCPFASSAQ
jgi:hypothetical protein